MAKDRISLLVMDRRVMARTRRRKIDASGVIISCLFAAKRLYNIKLEWSCYLSYFGSRFSA
jgi:hypothetical protein